MLLFSGIPSGTGQVVELKPIAEDKLQMEVYWEDPLLQYLDIKARVCLDGVLLGIKKIADS